LGNSGLFHVLRIQKDANVTSPEQPADKQNAFAIVWILNVPKGPMLLAWFSAGAIEK
jgi:hypothetical protein